MAEPIHFYVFYMNVKLYKSHLTGFTSVVLFCLVTDLPITIPSSLSLITEVLGNNRWKYVEKLNKTIFNNDSNAPYTADKSRT